MRQILRTLLKCDALSLRLPSLHDATSVRDHMVTNVPVLRKQIFSVFQRHHLILSKGWGAALSAIHRPHGLVFVRLKLRAYLPSRRATPPSRNLKGYVTYVSSV
jgi:hypothetical protein